MSSPPFLSAHPFLGQFLFRWLVSLFLLFLTYNPSRYSYYHWVVDGYGDPLQKLVVGITLIIAYIFLYYAIFAAWRGWGMLGAVTIGVLSTHELIKLLPAPTSTIEKQYVVLLVLSVLSAAGLSWSQAIYTYMGQKQKRYVLKDRPYFYFRRRLRWFR
ncbi:conserved membrane hypothetical protein [Gammaproteobacteria bacterium]